MLETRRSFISGAIATSVVVTRAEARSLQKPDFFSKEFYRLMLTYAPTAIEYPHLKNISFAQWALETGFGNGDPTRPGSDALPKRHNNFAGMKYRNEMAPYATSIRYTDWKGDTGNYCHFNSDKAFIKGYWLRFDVVGAYEGWRDHTKSAEQFISFVGPIWAPANDGNGDYAAKVLGVHQRLKESGNLPTG